MPMPESQPVRTFVPGPPVSPPGPLLAWLNEAAEAAPTRLVRLPVVLRFDPLRLGIASGEVAGDTAAAGAAGPIRLTLNDGALGTSLANRIRGLCAPDQDGCTVWLDGYWGLPSGAFPQEGQPEPDGGTQSLFSPVSVGDVVAAGQRRDELRAGIEQ